MWFCLISGVFKMTCFEWRKVLCNSYVTHLCVREKKINTTNDVNEENRIKVTYVEREKETDDVGIICVIIYDDLALKAWTQRRERAERESSERARGG